MCLIVYIHTGVEYTGVKGEGKKIEIASFERFTRAEVSVNFCMP